MRPEGPGCRSGGEVGVPQRIDFIAHLYYQLIYNDTRALDKAGR